jgi:hypothetical protein
MVLKDSMIGATFLIETSSGSNWTLNDKSGKLLGFEFDRNLMEFLLVTSDFDEIWEKDICLHLDENSTHEKEFEVSN